MLRESQGFSNGFTTLIELWPDNAQVWSHSLQHSHLLLGLLNLMPLLSKHLQGHVENQRDGKVKALRKGAHGHSHLSGATGCHRRHCRSQRLEHVPARRNMNTYTPKKKDPGSFNPTWYCNFSMKGQLVVEFKGFTPLHLEWCSHQVQRDEVN